MINFIRENQMNIMLAMSSISLIVALFALVTKSLPVKRKMAIIDIELSAAILLYSDRLAYMYHGDASEKGYWMVRVTNFLVFFLTISVVHALNLYITDLCRNEIGLSKVPVRLRIVEILSAVGWVMVIVSQPTGLYYYFDETNAYHRGPGFLVAYVIPFIILFIQLSVVFQYVKRLSLYISIPMILFTLLPLIASIFQALFYGISFTNMSIVGMAVVLYVFAIMEMNDKLEKAQRMELDKAKSARESIRKSFEQVLTAFSKATDARDTFTKEHSLRVAGYSRDIARSLGLDEQECSRVYYAGLLHDIGKIEIPESIIGKHERLTDAEKEELRKHSVIGGDILSAVEEWPYLRIAAKYHHERYDGKGYPEGLMGESIPLIARIVSVANAYDEMTSFKFDHQPFAQGRVREELVNGSGRRFDPKIAGIMIEMIDKDTDYMLREHEDQSLEESEQTDFTKVSRIHFDEYKKKVSDGIRITSEKTVIRFMTRPDSGYDIKNGAPSIILFDSTDRCVHHKERSIKKLNYFEYGEIWLDGHTVCTSARDMRSETVLNDSKESTEENGWILYEIEAVKVKDHVRIRIDSGKSTTIVITALPDSARFVYAGITGEHCYLKDISVTEKADAVEDDYIPRIAPEINLFNRKDGDIPNTEINGYRETETAPVEVRDGMRLLFHTQSLTTASLVAHCPYILLYSSENGEVSGKNYAEYACIRLDGDDVTEKPVGEKKLTVHRDEDFVGWDAWKEINKRGLDYEVEFTRLKNRISFETGNAGISIKCDVTVPKGADKVYVAMTGNQCLIMHIRIL